MIENKNILGKLLTAGVLSTVVASSLFAATNLTQYANKLSNEFYKAAKYKIKDKNIKTYANNIAKELKDYTKSINNKWRRKKILNDIRTTYENIEVSYTIGYKDAAKLKNEMGHLYNFLRMNGIRPYVRFNREERELSSMIYRINRGISRVHNKYLKITLIKTRENIRNIFRALHYQYSPNAKKDMIKSALFSLRVFNYRSLVSLDKKVKGSDKYYINSTKRIIKQLLDKYQGYTLNTHKMTRELGELEKQLSKFYSKNKNNQTIRVLIWKLNSLIKEEKYYIRVGKLNNREISKLKKYSDTLFRRALTVQYFSLDRNLRESKISRAAGEFKYLVGRFMAINNFRVPSIDIKKLEELKSIRIHLYKIKRYHETRKLDNLLRNAISGIIRYNKLNKRELNRIKSILKDEFVRINVEKYLIDNNSMKYRKVIETKNKVLDAIVKTSRELRIKLPKINTYQIYKLQKVRIRLRDIMNRYPEVKWEAKRVSDIVRTIIEKRIKYGLNSRDKRRIKAQIEDLKNRIKVKIYTNPNNDRRTLRTNNALQSIYDSLNYIERNIGIFSLTGENHNKLAALKKVMINAINIGKEYKNLGYVSKEFSELVKNEIYTIIKYKNKLGLHTKLDFERRLNDLYRKVNDIKHSTNDKRMIRGAEELIQTIQQDAKLLGLKLNKPVVRNSAGVVRPYIR